MTDREREDRENEGEKTNKTNNYPSPEVGTTSAIATPSESATLGNTEGGWVTDNRPLFASKKLSARRAAEQFKRGGSASTVATADRPVATTV